MLTFTIAADNPNMLRARLNEIMTLLDSPVLPGLALFSNEELLSELTTRQVMTPLPDGAVVLPQGNGNVMPASTAAPAGNVTPMRKRGRPPGSKNKTAEAFSASDQQPLPGQQAGAPAEPISAAAAPPTAAAAPTPEAAPAEPPAPAVPDQSAAAVAPSLPTEDEVLALMSEVYSLAGGNMDLVRKIMQEVGGKTQLTQIQIKLWPTLVARLNEEHARLTTQKAAT